jgi:hypothetical protein
MSGLCKTCSHAGQCTYRADGGAMFCEEFDDGTEIVELDWDLNELNRLFSPEDRGQESE